MRINITDNNKTKIGFVLSVIIGFLFLAYNKYFIRKRIEENGVFVKCQVVKSEGYKGGILTTVTYQFKNKQYSGQVPSNYKEAVGSFFFLKILPDRPEAVIFLEENSVPKCLSGLESPVDGWKKIPNCKE